MYIFIYLYFKSLFSYSSSSTSVVINQTIIISEYKQSGSIHVRTDPNKTE